jgi:Zn-dependent protease
MKCRKCGQETFLPFRCPYCGDQFCTEHRLPENHNCPRMDLARAQRQEDAMLQGPTSYEYKVTYRIPYKTRGRIYFSPKELKHLTVAVLLVIGVGFSIGYYYFAALGWVWLSLFAIILTFSFLVHEIAHKVTAQRQGLWAEFRLVLLGVILTFISVLPLFFKIISPGAVMISGPAQKDAIGKISIIGPITNIILSAVLLSIAFVLVQFSFVFLFSAYLNAIIALFNLIPLGILDGYKIFNWNKTFWASAFAVSALLFIITSLFVF